MADPKENKMVVEESVIIRIEAFVADEGAARDLILRHFAGEFVSVTGIPNAEANRDYARGRKDFLQAIAALAQDCDAIVQSEALHLLFMLKLGSAAPPPVVMAARLGLQSSNFFCAIYAVQLVTSISDVDSYQQALDTLRRLESSAHGVDYYVFANAFKSEKAKLEEALKTL